MWLTQPRASLGFNQPAELFARSFEQLPATCYVVVDEASEQTFPLHLGRFAAEHRGANLTRLRSFTKGVGLNGLRLASILHPTRLRAPFIHCLEFIGASVAESWLRSSLKTGKKGRTGEGRIEEM